jgi:hypothetical protein
MKKILCAAIFLLLTVFIFGDEIIVDKNGNKIVIKDDKSWEYLEDYRLQKLAENNLELSNLDLTGKRSGGRTLTGKIKNKGSFEFKSITLKVKFKKYDEYLTKEVFEISNLKPGEEREFERRIDVEDIEGRDYIIEIFSFE